MGDRLPITPETKVGALLEAYPELEPALVEMAPAFAKLRNPVLRRTIARVTTLATAAKVGEVPVRDMVRKLRKAAGVEDEEPEIDDGAEQAEPGPEPVWVSDAPTVDTIDADALLASDRTPLEVVMPRLAALSTGEKLCIRSGFRPEPLVEAIRKKGHAVHCRCSDAGTFETLVRGK